MTLDSKQTKEIIIIIWRNSVITYGGHVTQTRVKYIRERKGEKQTETDRQAGRERDLRVVFRRFTAPIISVGSSVGRTGLQLPMKHVFHASDTFRAKLLLTSDYNTDTNMQAKLVIFVSVVRLVTKKTTTNFDLSVSIQSQSVAFQSLPVFSRYVLTKLHMPSAGLSQEVTVTIHAIIITDSVTLLQKVKNEMGGPDCVNIRHPISKPMDI